MGHLFYMMGKSASGKDTLYEKLKKREELQLKPLVLYTTRPIREGETEGVEYHFTDTAGLHELQRQGRVIECREYQTMHGPWAYFTVDAADMDLERFDYIGIGTLESYKKIRDYFGKEKVIPLYIEVEDGLRLSRALSRERMQKEPKYSELCRRFLADSEDFSEEKLKEAGIRVRFENDKTADECLEKILAVIKPASGKNRDIGS